MIRLLTLEYYKFKKNAVISLLAIMFVATLPTVIFIGKEFENIPPPLPSNKMIFNFPLVWDYLGYSGSWLSFFFLGLISVFIVVNEISYKTFRQNVITGMTRKEYFLSKLYSIMVISLLAALYYGFIALTIGFMHAEELDWSKVFDSSYAVPRFFLMCMGYMSFGLFCGFVIRRSGVAVLFYLIYILMLESLIKWAVHFRIFENDSINYYPMNCVEDLMPFPIYRFADMIPKKGLNFEFLLSYSHAAIGTIFWSVVFLGIAYYSFIKRDI